MTKKGVERTYNSQKCCLRSVGNSLDFETQSASHECKQISQTDSPKTLTKKNAVMPWYSDAVNTHTHIHIYIYIYIYIYIKPQTQDWHNVKVNDLENRKKRLPTILHINHLPVIGYVKAVRNIVTRFLTCTMVLPSLYQYCQSTVL